MSKLNLFLDFDLTIVDTIKAFTDSYNIIYYDHPDFEFADPNKISSYDFRCICPLLDSSEKIFSREIFFQLLEFIEEDTYDILQRLNNKYKIIIVSIGTPSNIALKAKWLEKKLPFIKDYILITNEGCKMDKSIVNMKNGIFIDDIPSNLESTNAERKILFGRIYPWNEGWEGEHLLNWKEVGERFL